jgi:acetylornithine/N-succinyldiaminopimelate aminotransferase
MSSQKLSAEEIAKISAEFLVPVYRRPSLNFVSGKGATLFDDQGRDYIDFCAGIAVNVLGYADANLLEVAHKALDEPWHYSNLFNNQSSAELAKLLVQSSGFADRVHFSLCGASANEGAFKFARKYARVKHGEGKTSILAFSNAFHGRLFGSLAATPRPHYQDSFKPLMPGVRFAEYNNAESFLRSDGSDLCAVIVEPLQGEGGVHAASLEFLRELRDFCNLHDALLIFDEVQCGLGRTGNLWAWQNTGVAPDILTTAKPLANGLPIGAILVREKVASVLTPGDHASTFAGGPFITVVAGQVLQIVMQEEFLQAVRDKGAYIKSRIAQAQPKLVKEVRGEGLLLGLELACNAAELAQRAINFGLIVVAAGPNVLRLIPPLSISSEELDLGVARLLELLET